jgi:hypothetical protein
MCWFRQLVCTNDIFVLIVLCAGDFEGIAADELDCCGDVPVLLVHNVPLAPILPKCCCVIHHGSPGLSPMPFLTASEGKRGGGGVTEEREVEGVLRRKEKVVQEKIQKSAYFLLSPPPNNTHLSSLPVPPTTCDSLTGTFHAALEAGLPTVIVPIYGAKFSQFAFSPVML